MVRRDPGLGLSGVEQTNFRIQQQKQQRQLTGDPNGRRESNPASAAGTTVNNSVPKTSPNSFIEIVDGNLLKKLVGKLSLTNLYQVKVGPLSDQLRLHLTRYSVPGDQAIVSDLGLLCVDANLPTSSFATAEVKDNFIGVTQEFAHTRLYTDLDFTFYVDSDYDMLRFFEGWMDFIGGGNRTYIEGEPASSTDVRGNIYRRFNYPNFYKTNNLYITKFERTLGSKIVRATDTFNYSLQYQFINAFPKALTTMPISYGPADILKVTVTFNFDRYVVTRKENIPIQSSLSQTTNQTTNNSLPSNRPQEPVGAEQRTRGYQESLNRGINKSNFKYGR